MDVKQIRQKDVACSDDRDLIIEGRERFHLPKANRVRPMYIMLAL